MTTQQPPESEADTSKQAVAPHGLGRVLGAGRLEPTAVGSHLRDRLLVGAYQGNRR
jgi:hypothetical protein